MKRILVVLITVFLLVSCTDAEKAQETLENAGYTDINAGGYAWFSCGERDVWNTRFTATAPNGNKVSDAVCEGILKGSTIRFD